MSVATLVSPVGNYPTRLSRRESKVVEAAVAASATSDASAVMTLTNKTIDGDTNTVQDLAVTCLKTVAGNADKVVMGTTTTGVPKFDKVGLVNLAAGILPSHVIKFVRTNSTSATLTGVAVGDICINILPGAAGVPVVSIDLSVATDTLPVAPATTSYWTIVLRAAA